MVADVLAEDVVFLIVSVVSCRTVGMNVCSTIGYPDPELFT